ncbi:MAG: HD-GYP domain-containing protein [Faecalibacterium sp.]|nr:HD-GYP domain-containing protein [Faecalibacterium sp.]
MHRVKENTVLAMPIYNENGGILLNANTVLKQAYLKKLSEMGYPGLYIYDDVSADVTIDTLVSEPLRRKTMRALKKGDVDCCRAAAHSLVDQLLAKSDISVDMVSLASFDTYTYAHSLNVAILAIIIGINSGLNYDQITGLSEAALMHDIGKECISVDILNKKGRLTDEELKIVHSHAQLGYNKVKDDFRIPDTVKNAILSHHENEDGSGYPRQLKSKDIHYYAKIIHVCDVYDALVSNRIYRKALNPADAIEFLMSNSWVMFDVNYVRKVIECITPYPTGVTVKLSDGSPALVVQQNSQNHVRPKVLRLDTHTEIDLMKVLNVTIVDMLM